MHDLAHAQISSTRPNDGMLSLLLALRDEVLRQVSMRLPPTARCGCWLCGVTVLIKWCQLGCVRGDAAASHSQVWWCWLRGVTVLMWRCQLGCVRGDAAASHSQVWWCWLCGVTLLIWQC
jgi:hypothetical protein